MNSLLLCLLAIRLISFLAAGAEARAAGDFARIEGTVVDDNGARVRGASLEFAGNRGKSVVITAADGSYRLGLEPGRYEFTAKLQGFCPLHRGAILVSKSSEIRIDLQMFVGSYGDPTRTAADDVSNSGGQRCIYRNGFREDQLDAIPGTGVKPFVLYGRREEKNGSMSFSGSSRDDSRHGGALFIYNLLTLEANTIIYKAQDYSIEGIGAVTLQDGKQTWHGARTRVSLNEVLPKVILKEP